MYATPIHMLNEQFNNNKFYIKRDDLLPFLLAEIKSERLFYFLKN